MSTTSKTPNAPQVIIREMELEDLAGVYALGEKLFTADRWPNLYRTWDEYELVGIFSSDGDTCLIAEYEDKVVGFALGQMIDKRNSAWIYGYLVWLGVDPSIKGRGVGKRLVDRLTNRFISFGARMMLTDTDGDNKAAIEFFERQGFGNHQHHVYLSRNLTNDPAYIEQRQADKLRERPPRHSAKHHVPGGPPSMTLSDDPDTTSNEADTHDD
ncbi:GNAT family N-acetyltransferase [Persicimonas caeni]|uniref:GNAT family N-acetyltransferase n=1 Tax=Persicimonas caeni TaxID=2292766 RepID=A0A4Y6PRX7_PERCE|nr:GNAT family N-acetyltransferase [Persicimonas caeni]QDG51092.1 GNAT family N-acetyltransferase [Persicimonas caeni]QED32313.1 GNAT family N-acetyltransferase [Persicimonas caeni]